jgi:hypothetical protein
MSNPILGRIIHYFLARQSDRALAAGRPHGRLQVHAVGPDADRILLVIDRPSEGEGALSQELGFAGHLARQLSVLSGRGTDLDILSNGNMTATETGTALADLDLARFDAVVLMVGSSEALMLTPVPQWTADLTILLDDIEDSSPSSVHTFVIAVPPVRGLINFPRVIEPLVQSSIRRHNVATVAVCRTRPRASSLTFDIARSASDGRNSSADFKGWAALIAPAIHSTMTALGGKRSEEAANEPARQLSLDELNVIDTYPSPRIDRLVESARNLFGTTSAAVTFLDHDRRWVKSAVGTSGKETSRVGSLCDLAIDQAGVFVVEDAHLEPHVVPVPGQIDDVRFYAGFPLEAPTGRRIGVLCIMDDRPRRFDQPDSALLRELALQVQAELWGASHERV